MPEQTPEAIATMRMLMPMLVEWLLNPIAEQQFLLQQKVLNWDVINDMERQCGLPETPCPDSPVFRRDGLNTTR
jgi:hypothetical protein